FSFSRPRTTGIYPLSLHDALPISGDVADGAYQRALDAATTAEEVDAAEERWSPVARSLDAAREAILAYGAALGAAVRDAGGDNRSEEHTSELHHVKISYAVFCLKK